MMDTFYHSLYSDIFIHWILSNDINFDKDDITTSITRDDELGKTITFKGKKYSGTVSIWNNTIVEQVIYNNEDEKLLFYLHFTLIDMNQFKNLFYEFYNELLKMNNKNDINIAFCCTGGLSTSLFVYELLEVCKLQKIDYNLSSLSIDLLYDKINEYNAIYLAPQIAYLLPELMIYTKNKIPIYCIDATMFATKNYQEVLKTIQENLKL